MKSFLIKSTLTATAAILMIAAGAHAQTTTKKKVSNSSVATVQMDEQGKKKELPVSLSDDLYIYGPPVNDITSSSTADDSVDSKTGLSTRHKIGLKYKVTDTLSITPVADLIYQLTDPNNGGADRGMHNKMNDPYLKISKKNVINGKIGANEISTEAQVRYYAPMSAKSRDNNLNGKVELDLYPTMKIGKSRFSAEMFSFARFYINSQKFDSATGSSALTSALYYVGPQVNYSLNDNITAFVLYEAALPINTLGQSANTFAPTASLTDLEPGMSFQVNKAISITPFLNWYTNQQLKTTSINLNATIQML